MPRTLLSKNNIALLKLGHCLKKSEYEECASLLENMREEQLSELETQAYHLSLLEYQEKTLQFDQLKVTLAQFFERRYDSRTARRDRGAIARAFTRHRSRRRTDMSVGDYA